MKDYIKRNGLRVGIAAVILALIAVLSASLMRGRAGIVTDVTGGVSSPVGSAFSSVFEWLEGL